MPGQDHTSLNDVTLAVGNNTVQVPVPTLCAVKALALVAGSVQAVGVVPGGLGKKGGPYGKVALFRIEEGRLVVGACSGGCVVHPRWYREDRHLYRVSQDSWSGWGWQSRHVWSQGLWYIC